MTELFNQALVQLQQKNWDASITLYRQLLDQSLSEAQASVVYHNMSTIAAEKADFLMAYAWSKKALWLDPSNSAARFAFEQFSAQFQAPTVPHQISNFDNFIGLIGRVPLDVWIFVTGGLLLLTIWLLARNWVLQKKNRLNEVFTTAGKWPVGVALLFTVLFIIISYFAYSQSELTRGILIADKARIQTAPGENKPVIFEAPAGLEVEVLNLADGYYQVRSAGAFSGWVQQSNVELMSLNFEHKK
jgi:hypothetical protein